MCRKIGEKMRKLSLEEISQSRIPPKDMKSHARFPFHVLLNDIRSLYNVGSIFRTADAVRIEKIYLTGITGKPPRKEIDKTALGATNTVPWIYYKNPLDILTQMKSDGISIVALEHTDDVFDFRKVQYSFPLCLILGNEVFGIEDELLRMADSVIEIPMYGSKHSLNVSVAFGIVIYEMLSQFQKSNKYNKICG
jgi:tRNA G18 (ribose-2'-O)-methylase SpoU